MATAAFMAMKPFKAIAGISSSFVGNSYNHLVFLHTAENDFPLFDKTVGYIQNIKKSHRETILVHSGVQHSSGFDFDIPPAESRTKDYTVISKNGLNAGVIYINKEEQDVISRVNNLAAMLKKEKDCQVVVCVSRLGYKNKYAVDDMKLAAGSQNVDLVIGGHPSNYTTKTMVTRNSVKHEVIVQSSKTDTLDCGKIEFSFDNTGTKKHVHIANKLYKETVTV